MFKKFMLYALIGVIGVQPYMVDAGVSLDAAPEVVQTVISEGEKIIVPLASAMWNLGDACVNGVVAGGRILWVTTKLGVKCVCILSEGCVYLAEFSATNPQFVSGVAVGAGAACLIFKYLKWQKKQGLNDAAYTVRTGNRIIDGRFPV